MKNRIRFFGVFILVVLVAFSCVFILTDYSANASANVVYLGGTPIGITVEADGMVVAELVDVITKDGTKKPAEN